MTTTEAARALGGINPDFVLRLIRCGQLPATKDERGRWDIPAEAVEARRRRIEHKRRSRVNVETKRAEARERAELAFS